MSAGLRDYNFTSDFARRYIAEGREEGRREGEALGYAKSILTVLDARGIDVSDRVRHIVISSKDLDQLQKWLRRALEINQADELLDRLRTGAKTDRGQQRIFPGYASAVSEATESDGDIVPAEPE